MNGLGAIGVEAPPAAPPPSILEGVVFHRTVRATFAVLLLAVNNSERVVVRIQMQDGSQAPQIRSWCRRMCKIGDLMVLTGKWAPAHQQGETDWHEDRFVVDVLNETDAAAKIVLTVARHWGVDLCQEWQKRCIVKKNNQDNKKRLQEKSDESAKEKLYRHGGGIGKRNQGELIANFLIHVVLHKLGATDLPDSEWGTNNPDSSNPLFERVIRSLNMGCGVVDAAGGSGHVSMALGLRGVKATVVDPREKAGKLPGRDRKVWNKSIRNNLVTSTQDGIPLCQPIVPYDTLRAWFAAKPDGVDTSFRHPDEEEIQVCSESHELLTNCSAIVALHPDEATGSIVDMAVRKRVPFVVMPCCVFSRLFPARRLPGSGDPVSTYDDLIQYLMAKDVEIKKTVLPFDGANIALWSTFS